MDRDCLNYRTTVQKKKEQLLPASWDQLCETRRNRVCPNLLSCYWNKHHKQKELREERTCFSLQVAIHHRCELRQVLDVETEVETMKEQHCLLPCSLAHSQLPSLHSPAHLPRDVTAPSGLNHSRWIINLENPTGVLTGQCYGSYYSTEVHFSWMLTTRKNHHRGQDHRINIQMFIEMSKST